MHLGKLLRPLLIAAFLLLPMQAFAYVGPGLGAGTLGVILGLLGSILLALFAFFWYPIKRALFGKKDKDDDEEEELSPVANTPESELAGKAEEK